MNTGYDDPDEHTPYKDLGLWLFRAALWTALIYTGYQTFTQRWQFFPTVMLAYVAIIVIEVVVLHVVNYGFHRKTRTDKWEEIYNGNLSTYEQFNRKATIWWMLGFKDYAMQYVDRADWALCDAQVMLANRDEFIRGEWDGEV